MSADCPTDFHSAAHLTGNDKLADEMKPYRDFGDFLSEHFDCKVQKISINAGFTCPNRDGTKGRGGCTYCNNRTFNPDYCATGLSVTEQLERGKHFFARKYPHMKYLAYFQAYTNTYAEIAELKAMYEEALVVDDVEGLIIGTRPDCVPDSLLDYMQELSLRTFGVWGRRVQWQDIGENQARALVGRHCRCCDANPPERNIVWASLDFRASR